MRSSVARFARRVLPGVVAAAVLMLVVPGHLTGATVQVVSFTIDDGFANAKVLSDLGTTTAYSDYRLPGGDQCIEAEPASTGLLHAVLNRKVDTAGTRCNPNGSDRQYRIHLTAAPVACQKLTAAYGTGILNIALGECELQWTANPRIRVSNLYKRGATSTPLAFLADNSTPLNYEIRALSNVPMATSNDRRTLTYDGQGMLYEFGNGKAKFVGEAFDMDLRMVFDRIAVTQ